MEKYEVTNERYRLCVAADVCGPPSFQLSTYGQAEKDRFPVTGVDAGQAAEFCIWIKRHLPTVDEWEHTATRGRTLQWPWGDDEPSPEVANLCYENCELLGGAPHEVGSHKDGVEGGIYDLIGNVSEWTRTGMSEDLQPIEQWSDDNRFLVPSRLAHVGGSYVTDVYGALVGGRLSGQPSPYVGFRCVETGTH
jgi:formylglycine-generating enzyme required for sulfatase activity